MGQAILIILSALAFAAGLLFVAIVKLVEIIEVVALTIAVLFFYIIFSSISRKD